MRRGWMGAVLLLASCGEGDGDCRAVLCGPCPPSIVLAIEDETGRPVPGATISGVEGWCFATPPDGETFCAAQAAPGGYEVTVSAPARASATVTVKVLPASPPPGPSCCAGCPAAPAQTVVLPPAQPPT